MPKVCTPSPRFTAYLLSCKSGHKSTRRTVFCKRKIEARSRNHCWRGKAVRVYTYVCSECVPVVSVIQHAKRVLLILLSSVACVSLLYLFTLSPKRIDFGGEKTVIYHNMSVFILSVMFSRTFMVLQKSQRGVIITVHRWVFV